MSNASIGEKITGWALHETTVQALVQIGSRVKGASADAGGADAYSDWDFYIITTRSALFSNPRWLESAGLAKPIAYAVRFTRLGHTPKVSAVLPNGELDLVLLPAPRLRMAKMVVSSGLIRHLANAQAALADLSIFLRPGYRIMKGEASWGKFLGYVAGQIPAPRLTDADVATMVEGFICDYISTLRKIARGELIAAQRWLHQQLAETNFRLLHELRQRQGGISFPDGRRLEMVAEPRLLEVSVTAWLDQRSLLAATDKCAQTCQTLAHELLGQQWQWPSSLSV